MVGWTETTTTWNRNLIHFKTMTIKDLSKDQLHELKERYLMLLADDGTFAEVMDVDYDAPSYGDLANADKIVPDDVIEREYGDVCFVADDFFCTANI